MKRRVTINLTFSADLDMVPGWGHEPDDWVQAVQDRLEGLGAHYKPALEIHSVSVEDDTGFEKNLRQMFEAWGCDAEKAMAEFKQRIESHR